MPKKKIVWLCHFANDEVKRELDVQSNLVFAPWITELIKLFANKNDVELFIVAPNYFNNRDVSFSKDGISYNFFKCRRSFLPFKAQDISYNYNISKKSVNSVISKINPDIIHLHGSENPIYSAAAIDLIDSYKVLVTIQGFIFLSAGRKNVVKELVRKNRIRIERKINSKAKYFTSATKNTHRLLNSLTVTAKVFTSYYPTVIPNVSSRHVSGKKYDIVYFARISKEKGIEDLVKAIKVLKKTQPSIRAIIIGGGSVSYVKYIINLIHSTHLDDNIVFAGFQTSQQEMFKLAVQARVSVLPTYFDALPGSIREAMFMRLPIVAYAVGGIPSFNEDKECITLDEKGNINELVEKINLVLRDPKRTNRLTENAFSLITNKYDNAKVYSGLLNIYNDILTSNQSK